MESFMDRFQKLIYLHLCTDYFMQISPQSSKQIQLSILNHLHALYAVVLGGLGGVIE